MITIWWKVVAFACCFFAACIDVYLGEMVAAAFMFLASLCWLFMIMNDMDVGGRPA